MTPTAAALAALRRARDEIAGEGYAYIYARSALAAHVHDVTRHPVSLDLVLSIGEGIMKYSHREDVTKAHVVALFDRAIADLEFDERFEDIQRLLIFHR